MKTCSVRGGSVHEEAKAKQNFYSEEKAHEEQEHQNECPGTPKADATKLPFNSGPMLQLLSRLFLGFLHPRVFLLAAVFAPTSLPFPVLPPHLCSLPLPLWPSSFLITQQVSLDLFSSKKPLLIPSSFFFLNHESLLRIGYISVFAPAIPTCLQPPSLAFFYLH